MQKFDFSALIAFLKAVIAFIKGLLGLLKGEEESSN